MTLVAQAALWAGWIHNPTGQSPGSGPNATTPIDCNGAHLR